MHVEGFNCIVFIPKPFLDYDAFLNDSIIMETIKFNDQQFAGFTYHKNILKHYGDRTNEILTYIYKTLDGQHRPPDETDSHGEVYKVASAIVGNEAPKISEFSEFRDTYFRIKENGPLFFHCSPRTPKQFNKISDHQKKRID
jgi:hypothetical protein